MLRATPPRLAGLVCLLFWGAPSLVHADRHASVIALAELSGPYASIGEECRRGYAIAEHDFARSGPVEIAVRYGDHRRTPAAGISEVRRLLEREPVAALVSNAAPVILALNPISAAEHLPFAGTVVHPAFTAENPFAYRFWPAAREEGAAIAQKLRSIGLKRLAMIVLQDDYPVLVGAETAAKFEALGGKLVFNEPLYAATSEYGSLLARLRAAKPDAIFVNILGDQLAVLMRRLREQGFSQPLFGTFSLGRPDILKSAGESAEGAMFVEIDARGPRFSDRLAHEFGAAHPTGMNYACYSALAAVLFAIQSDGSADRAALQRALGALREVPLLDERLKIEDREARYTIAVRSVHAGAVN